MLVELHVKNFALVENKCIQFSKGMTAFTGETGAGKSLLLNAVTLLLGSKAQKDMVRDGQTSALVEGVFNLASDPSRAKWLDENGFNFEGDDGNLLVVKRELSVTSKSKNRIWIQGMAATRHQLQELLGDWIEISGQHEFLRLNKDSYLLDVLDQYSRNHSLLKDYQAFYTQHKDLENRLKTLQSNNQDKSSLLDLKRFQLEELCKAKVTGSLELELENLISSQEKLKSKESILEAAQVALSTLDPQISDLEDGAGAMELLKKAANSLREFTQLDGPLSKAFELIESARSSLLDAKAHLEESGSGLDNDPKSLEKIESRISTINRLKRKFRCDVNELFEIRLSLERDLEDLENYDAKIVELQKQLKLSLKNLNTSADNLFISRKSHAAKLETLWQKGVRELGIPKASFEFALSKGEDFGPRGNTQLELLFSANHGSKARPIKQVASGGELSRILLALKHIVSNKSEVCAYLFDEIDTGIGGETAQTVGLRLREIAEDSQVIVVTHLPQVAAMASDHFLIEKQTKGSQTSTEICELKGKDREKEIARMLGSSKSKAATTLAKEMLKGKSSK